MIELFIFFISIATIGFIPTVGLAIGYLTFIVVMQLRKDKKTYELIRDVEDIRAKTPYK